jgi:hypothetical protein
VRGETNRPKKDNNTLLPEVVMKKLLIAAALGALTLIAVSPLLQATCR